MSRSLPFVSLPPEIIDPILREVCECGFKDLCRAKATCKVIRDIVDSVEFHKGVDLYVMQTPEIPLEGVKNFKLRCLQLGNPSAHFCFGTHQFFKEGKLDTGLESLRLSAEGGYEFGVYAYALLVRILNPLNRIESGVAFVSRKFIRNAREKLEEIPDIAWPMFEWRPPVYDQRVNELAAEDVYACTCCPTRKWPRAWYERSKAGRMCDNCFWLCQKLWFAREFPRKVLSWPDQHHAMNSAAVEANDVGWGQQVQQGNNGGWGQEVEANNGGWGQQPEDNEGDGGWGQDQA